MTSLELSLPSLSSVGKGIKYDIFDIIQASDGSIYAVFGNSTLGVREVVIDCEKMYISSDETPITRHILSVYNLNFFDDYLDGTLLDLGKLSKEGMEMNFSRRSDLLSKNGEINTFLGSILTNDAFAEKKKACKAVVTGDGKLPNYVKEKK